MPKITTTPFGVLPDGREAHLFTLEDGGGHSVTLTDMGAAVRDIVVPDIGGKPADVSLCHASFEDSVENDGCFGATCGRVANRIRDGRFALNGATYELNANYPGFILHGGVKGFHHALWDAEVTSGGVVFRHRSPDGDQGFPGAVEITAGYTFSGGVLGVEYTAVSGADTVVNLTNHTYFNLNGHADGSIAGHTAQLFCDYFLPIDDQARVTGEVRLAAGTPMDFTQPRELGGCLNGGDEQLKNGNGGCDHSFVLRQGLGEGLRLCARVRSPKTGITLETYTDYPAVHLYTGNNLLPYNGKGGAVYAKHGAFCLETQLFPDFINCPAFEKHILKPGRLYHYRTEYKFITGG